jgi:hypothetical protein
MPFTLTPGRCFLMVRLDCVGHYDHCREPVAYRGRFQAPNATYRVESREGHAHKLSGAVVDLRAVGRKHE